VDKHSLAIFGALTWSISQTKEVPNYLALFLDIVVTNSTILLFVDFSIGVS
jgi:hypothetical protein